MTLPFRRRHHDDESSHDRARALTSVGMLESLSDEDAGWLARHLEACGECRQEREAFLADRALLRGLREHTPEPPRDLWARTSAALEREARSQRGRGTAAPARRSGLPFGALAGAPVGMTISPNEDQLVVEAPGAGIAPNRILVVPVPLASPAVTPRPTEPPNTESPSAEPATPEPGSPEPSVIPDEIIEIASGVVVVGEAAYSADGWLAFSARPSDGSTGPDLYLWRVGQPTAVAVTSDHRTYFSTWLGGRVLASRVDEAANPEASDAPTAAPDANASTEPAPIEAHPSSFLLDPATLTRTDIAQPDLWMPVVDPTGRFVAYWSGTLRPTADGLDWQLATGELVLDGWSAGPDARPTADPAATPAPALGPAGTAVSVIRGPTAAFKAKFDPTGTRLAVWVGEQADAEVGRLHLIVLDATTGAPAAGPEPLPGEPALRRFSIDVGRVAWVSPSGQDGQESAVQVLGWTSTEFGEIRTVPGKGLYLVR